MKKINIKEKKVTTKKCLIESIVFFIFFLIVTIIYPNIGGVVFLLICGLLVVIFGVKYINENKD